MNATQTTSKTPLFTHFARVAKALASPVRLELLEALAQGEHSVDELARRGEVAVIDVRPRDEFHAGHVKGAINIPLEELGLHLADLPREHEIVAYCRGPYCVLSFDAVVDELRRQGFRGRRLDAGYPEWKVPPARGHGDAPGAA